MQEPQPAERLRRDGQSADVDLVWTEFEPCATFRGDDGAACAVCGWLADEHETSSEPELVGSGA